MHTSAAVLARDNNVAMARALPRPEDGIQGWIDEAPASAQVGEEIRVVGWCYFPAAEIRSVHVVLGRKRYACEFGRLRADVATGHPDEPRAMQCGFEATFLARGQWNGLIRIEARLTDGQLAAFDSDRRLTIVRRSFRQRVRGAFKRIVPSGRIRVMCVTNDLNMTGGPLYLVELVTELKRTGVIEPLIVSPRDGGLRSELERTGIEVRIRDGLLKSSGGSMQAGISSLAREMVRERVEVVYANTIDTFPAIAAAREAGIAAFWNIHESEPWREFFERLPSISEPRVRELFAYPHRVMFPAQATRGVYAELDSGNFCVLGNAIDGRRIERAAALYPRVEGRQRLGIAADEIMVLLLGTVCERKGQMDLPGALALLPEELLRRVRCFVVGDRSSGYSDALHALIAALPGHVRRQITVVAETPETSLYYGAADVFVCTSRVESFPRVILEAMHYGLPIVTTGVFGIRGQVREGINGLFYEPGDATGLAAALGELLADGAKREHMGRSAREVLGTLGTFEDMVAGYGRVLRAARDTGR